MPSAISRSPPGGASTTSPWPTRKRALPPEEQARQLFEQGWPPWPRGNPAAAERRFAQATVPRPGPNARYHLAHARSLAGLDRRKGGGARPRACTRGRSQERRNPDRTRRRLSRSRIPAAGQEELRAGAGFQPLQRKGAPGAAGGPVRAWQGRRTDPGGNTDRSTMLLHGATLFCGAFLLFWLQPLVARMLLPRAGGVPAVWNAVMLFFQAALLAGYLLGPPPLPASNGGARRSSRVCCLALSLLFLPPLLPADLLPPPSGGVAVWFLVRAGGRLRPAGRGHLGHRPAAAGVVLPERTRRGGRPLLPLRGQQPGQPGRAARLPGADRAAGPRSARNRGPGPPDSFC